MRQKIRIGSALILALALVVGALAPSAALAGGPLLSGYGGPGAGEQAILGSTLVGGSGGGSGSGSSSGGGRGGAGGGSSTGAAVGGSAAAGAKAGATESHTGESAASHGRRRRGGAAAGHEGRARVSPRGVNAYVYSTKLRAASYSSPALGVSAGDLLALVVTIATLALLAVLTIRVRRLQG